MGSINERLRHLENEVLDLLSKVRELSLETKDKPKIPLSKVGSNLDVTLFHSPDIDTGLGRQFGGTIVWNDSEVKIPPLNQQPVAPTIGYNKHSHNRYSGGALMKDFLEIVEYDWTRFDEAIPPITNKHSQQYLGLTENDIATVKKTGSEETVKKIGLLDLIFNPDIRKWGASAYEINVQKCYLVKRRTTANKDESGEVIPGENIGDIEKDENGNEMKSLLYIEETKDDGTGKMATSQDKTKSAVVWDKNARVFRFFAVYAPEEA
jgi:hypothetical protein